MTSLTRRAFVWRSALLAGGAVLGTSLLAACGTQAQPPTSSGGAPAAAPTAAPATGSGAPAAAPTSAAAGQPAAAGASGGTLSVGLGRVLQDLNGFDLEQSRRLGVFYAVRDAELGEQTLGVDAEFPFAEDPSLWSVLELIA